MKVTHYLRLALNETTLGPDRVVMVDVGAPEGARLVMVRTCNDHVAWVDLDALADEVDRLRRMADAFAAVDKGEVIV